jgi:general secretion pathway protein L
MAVRDLTLPAFGPRLSELARRVGVAGFWPWWTAQLNALVPPKPRAALERRRMRPVLMFDGEQATLWSPSMEGDHAMMRAAASFALVGDAATVAADGRAAVALLGPKSNGAPKVMLSVPARDVLRKTVVLPAAVEPNLRQTLAYDLDRHTPFKPEELYFDAVVIGRTPQTKEIRVDLVCCRKTLVDAAMRHATAWGAAVSAVVPDSPARAYSSRLNLLPHEARSSRAVWKRWQFWLPMALVAVVALAAIVIPLWQKRDYAIALNAVANDARGQAAISDALRTELETKVSDFNFALEKKYAYPSAFRVVDEVSRVLPDDTWLTQFELKTVTKAKEATREILVRGETGNAGRLVQLFEESPLFAQTAPRSPTTKIQPGPGEIFDLGAQLKPLPAPAPVTLLPVEKPAPAVSAAPAAAPASANATPPATSAMPAATTPIPAGAMGPEAPAASPPATSAAAPAASPAGSPASAPAGIPASAPAGTPASVSSAPPAAPAPPSAAPVAPVAATPLPVASAPPAAAVKAAAVPPPGTPDPWVSARPRPARAPGMAASEAPAASGAASNAAPAGAKQ